VVDTTDMGTCRDRAPDAGSGHIPLLAYLGDKSRSLEKGLYTQGSVGYLESRKSCFSCPVDKGRSVLDRFYFGDGGRLLLVGRRPHQLI
jgi:hypothetical protein